LVLIIGEYSYVNRPIVLHPMLSVSYIFAIIFGAIFLGEYLKFMQGVAVIIIIIGVVLIGGGDVN